jgi:hypothetical protein
MSSTKFTRRALLRRTLAGGAVLTVFASGHYKIALGQAPVVYRLRILHTNDHHARIEPANVTLQSTPSTITRNFGGVARRKTLMTCCCSMRATSFRARCISTFTTEQRTRRFITR